mmetsp:Transcript_48235/g.48616  ORF Transcript_48235/g.48616 Transcript_48235/m.48616 type:complete len:84 (-) Transcript_48235:112-363(-)
MHAQIPSSELIVTNQNLRYDDKTAKKKSRYQKEHLGSRFPDRLGGQHPRHFPHNLIEGQFVDTVFQKEAFQNEHHRDQYYRAD